MSKSDSAILSRLSRNTLVLYGAYVVRKLSVFILAMVVARETGAGGFGTYCLALVMMEFGISLAVFGTDILLVREVSASDPDQDRLAGNAWTLRLVLAACIVPVLAGLAALVSEESLLRQAVMLMGTGMLAHALGDVYLSVIQGHERVDLHGLVLGATHALGLGFGVAALVLGWGVPGLAIAYSLRGLCNLLIAASVCRAQGWTVRPGLELGFLGTVLRKALPIAANRLLTIAYLGSGLAVLEWYRGNEVVGQFAGPVNLFQVCAAFGMLTMVAAFPTLTRLVSDKARLRKTVEAIVRFFWWVGLPLSVLVALNAGPLLGLIFGSEFSLYGRALVLLMAAVPFSLNFVLIERLAYAFNDRVRVFVVRVLGMLVNLGVLFAFLGRAGYLAPAMAILAAEMTMFIAFLVRYRRYSGGSSFARVIAMPLAACTLALAATQALSSRMSLSPSLLFAAGFVGMALAYRGVRSTRPARP